MLLFVAFIFGLIIGSFLNVIIYRLPRGESVVLPASRCPECGQRLEARDLIPVLSWLVLRGRCRFCGRPIPARYPLVELVTGAAFLFLYWQDGLSVKTAAGLVLTGVLIASAFIDIEYGIIPNRLTYPALAVGLALSLWTVGLASALMGAALFAGALLLAALASRGGMGLGDVKLAAVIGAFSGWEGALAAFFLSSFLGGIWALLLIAFKGAGRKTAIRFGPFLAVGGYIGFVLGARLICWYAGIATR